MLLEKSFVIFELNLKLKILLNTYKWKILGIKMGSKTRIYPNFWSNSPKTINLGYNVTIFEGVRIYSKRGKVFVGDYTHLSSFVYILSEFTEVTIGKDVAIGPYTTIIASSNHYEQKIPTLFRKITIRNPVKIGNNVLIGAHVVILPGTVIEDNVIIGANSVVKGYLKGNRIYAGIPAREIKTFKELRKDD